LDLSGYNISIKTDNMQSTFTVKTKELKAALNFMERVGGKFAKTTMLKISILPDNIEIGKQGMTRIVKAQTGGLADVMVPGMVLKGYLSTASAVALTFTFGNGYMQCGSSTFSSPAITIETIFNMPENDLPVNATRMSVLRFAATKTEEEVARLGLSGSIKYAKKVQREKIQKAVELLKDYEVTFEELKQLIDGKVRG
jgi:hypothetical protein